MYKKYAEIRDKLGYTDYAVSKATGISKSSFTDWKSGRSNFKIERLQKIAEFFEVPVTSFLDESSPLQADSLYSLEEKAIIEAYRTTSDDNKRSVRLILGLKK